MTHDHAVDRLVELCFKNYYKDLHRYAYTFLKSNEAAGDAVQSVFLKIWEKRTLLVAEQGVRAYLYTAIQHHCLNIMRRQKIMEKYQSQIQYSNESGNKLISKENYDRILHTIDQLPEQCKIVFLKSRFEKKSYQEISKELNISVKTVEVHMGKALRILRSKLSGILFLYMLLINFTLNSN
ncbi:RNA polymerase sigma-70 factor, ECF subfamily [Chitinophaga eiseniae]|uniref:RNA polymerase sigma-70 factor, ECF subfamily n=1 Tax=Chitinophaga eiseniae TaxID=634771 RepID=A0A1T4T6V2_9BACT|nr:RNA polymerase sigma-70 factor [Chitinophaga eiseniae]SKA35878.1 RNA polymerase sigma-70 factor, ECF subfamily [Chitinophaga eiseniae]